MGAHSEAAPGRGARTRSPLAFLSAVLLVEAATYSILTPLLPGLVARLSLSTSQAGVLFGGYLLAYTVGVLLGWWQVSRLGLRRATRMALMVFAASSVGFALADSYWLAVAMRFSAGVAGGLTWVAVLTWLVSLSGTGDRGKTVGTAFSVALLGTLLGPLIGNAAVAVGFLPVFGAIAVVCLVVAAVLPPEPIGRAPGRRTPRDLRPAAPGARRAAVVAAIATFAIATTYGSLFVILPLRLSDAGAPSSWIGWVFALSAALAAVMNRVGGSAADTYGFRPFSAISLVGGATMLLLLTLTSSLPIDVLVAVFGLGVVLAIGLASSSASVSLEAERAGARDVTVSVLVVIVFSGGSTFGSFMAPAVAEWVSPEASLTLLVTINLAAAAILALGRSRVRA